MANLLRLLFRLSPLLVAASAIACSSTATKVPGPLGDAPDATGAGSNNTCVITPRDFDQSCTTNADCTTVLPGGDTCDPCAQSYLFTCGQAPINVGAVTAYNAALTKALPTPPGIHFSAQHCGLVASCPVAQAAVCVQGSCVLARP